jgi:NADPH-dependent 2,4-dienoyl-CoA reductase/sulfur reductase-like enzyme
MPWSASTSAFPTSTPEHAWWRALRSPQLDQLVDKALGGRASEIRGCISCNQQCWGRRSRDYWISCLVNPSVGREWQWGGDTFERTTAPKRVLVVGGGPAGLEAARVAAERGHRVSLVEAGPHLGGAFRLAGLQPGRGQITDVQQPRLGQQVLDIVLPF